MPPLHPVRTPILRPRGAAGLAWLLAACVATGMARADVTTKPEEKKKKKDPEVLIPEVRDMAATFVAGKSVNIELSASTSSLRPLEFLIRQQPANGTLSAPRSHPRETNKCIVTYVHRGGDAPLSDRFTFACRVDGGPVSAAAAVTLTGQRFEPRLEVVDYMAVDKVFIGGEAAIRFVVKNGGAADFAADIPWEEPWDGPARIELKAGETGRYAVHFRPAKPGVYRMEKLLQPGVAGSKLPLYGQCVRPLTVSPGRLVLTLGSGGARGGVLQLANGRPEPMKVEVQPAGRLQGGRTVEVPGGGRVRVVLSLPPDDVAAYQGELKIIAPQGEETVAVEAAAKPAELSVVSPAGSVLDLGSAPAGREARGEVTIRNTGGSTAVIQAQARAPLAVRPSGEAIRLEPGGQTVFALTMIGDRPGPLARDLTFSGDLLATRIEVQLQVLPAVSAAAPATATRPGPLGGELRETEPQLSGEGGVEARTPMQRLLLSYLAASGLPIPKERINPFLERITALELLERTSQGITIAWKKPNVTPAGWIIEGATMARIEEGGGSFVKLWTPLKNWKIVDGGAKRVAARIEPLPAGSQIELRIMGVDRDEKVAEPSPGFLLTTTAAWSIPSWVWRALLILLLAAAIYVLNKMRLGEWQWKFRRDAKPATS
jgi:hypothetical protein